MTSELELIQAQARARRSLAQRKTAQEIDPQPQANSAPSVQDIFNLDPEVKNRGAILPLGTDQDNNVVVTPSTMMLDLMDALTLPGRILKGHVPTDQEILNFTAATAGSSPRGMASASKVGPARAAPNVGGKTAKEAAEEAIQQATETGVPRGGPDMNDLRTGARQARFEEQGIPATRGDLTQDFAQQADEARLVSMASGPEAEPLRQMRLQQSEAFVGKVNELVDSLGIPKGTGDRVKEVLSGRADLLRRQKSALYKQVAEAAPEVANAPIITDQIVLAIPDARTIRRLRTLSPNAVKAVEELFVEFGLDASDDAVKAFTRSGGEITPLTLGNFDDFRVALGQIDRADQTGAVKVITGPIRRALDEEATFIDDAIRESGVTDQSIVATLKQARERVRTLKTEFSPQSTAGRLIDVKRDGVTPVVEASKVANELLRPNAPIENLQRVLTSLGKAGEKGKLAIGDLQASVVADALEATLKAPSRKTSGIQTIDGNLFAKSLDKFGDDKLALLFKNNPEALRILMDLRQTGLDISPAAGAVPKGSAPVILDLINRLGKIPGLSAISDIANGLAFIKSVGGDKAAVARALDSAEPVIKKTVKAMELRYPALFEMGLRIGGTQIVPEQKKIRSLSDLDDTA